MIETTKRIEMTERKEDRGLEPIVLDVDGTIVRQRELLDKYGPIVMPLRGKSEELRYWTSEESLGWLRRVFTATAGAMQGKLVFYGSGDYHHLSLALVSMIAEPVSIVHFDNHTDWSRSPGGVHLGSWVEHALKMPHVRKVVQFGVDGDLNQKNNAMGLPLPIGTPSHDMSLMGTGEVEVYPAAMSRSTLVGRVKLESPCAGFEPGRLNTEVEWKNFRDHGGLAATLERVLATLPTDAVYLTIDKDVLREEDAVTNYYRGSQGVTTLGELLEAIPVISRRKKIVAADVCGDGSQPTVRPFSGKAFFKKVKDKQIPDGIYDAPASRRINEGANLKIADLLAVAPEDDRSSRAHQP